MSATKKEQSGRITYSGIIDTTKSICDLPSMGLSLVPSGRRGEVVVVYQSTDMKEGSVITHLSAESMVETHKKNKKGPKDILRNLEDEVGLFVMTQLGRHFFSPPDVRDDIERHSKNIEESMKLVDKWIGDGIIKNSIAAWRLAHIALGEKSNCLEARLKRGQNHLLDESIKASKQWVYLISPPNREWIERWFVMAKDRKTFSSFFDPILFVDIY